MVFSKCAKGHIYDSGIYPSCPYCSDDRGLLIDFSPKSAEGPGPEAASGYVYDGSTVTMDGGSTQPVFPPSNQAAASPGPAFSPNYWEKASRSDQGPDQDSDTRITDRKSNGIIPAAGWLVCMKGNMRGRSYTLRCRQNTIGRDSTKDVCIEGDMTISRYQADIFYDERQNQFTIVPRTETNTMYLNDEPVYEAVCLKAEDLIEMGRSAFVFIPFCGERFQWDMDEDT